jgi:hypothetical protein
MDQYELDLCTDCTYCEVNGLHGWEYSESWLSAYELGRKNYVHVYLSYDSETGDGYDEFSRVKCSLCGTTLAGARYTAVAMDE